MSFGFIAVEGYCFHDEEENRADTDVPCGGKDTVSADCLTEGGTCRYFGWCRAKNFKFTTDIDGNVVDFEDLNDYEWEQE